MIIAIGHGPPEGIDFIGNFGISVKSTHDHPHNNLRTGANDGGLIMQQDWSRFVANASDKSDEQLMIESEWSDYLGGNAALRASAKVELNRRAQIAAERLTDKQLMVAKYQACAAWAAVVVAVMVVFFTLLRK